MPTNNAELDPEKRSLEKETSQSSTAPRPKSLTDRTDGISRPGTPSTVHSTSSESSTPIAAEDSHRSPPDLGLRQEQSCASTVLPPPVIVPRHQRRGLLSRFTLIPEVTNPYCYTGRTKWAVTAVIALSAAAAPMGSAIILPALALIADDLGATPTVTNLSVALYMLSMSIFPLWWSSFSEQLGRRSVLIFSFFLFAVFALLSAVSTNIAMLIVMRVLSGGAAASVQAVGAGGIADIWEPKERGKAMGIFYLGPLCGPLLAPIFGGAMAETQGWRSTQWFLFAFGVATTILLTFGLPETLPRSSILVEEENTNDVEPEDNCNQPQQEKDLENAITDASEPAQPVRTTKSNSAPRVEPLTKISTTKSVHLKTKRFLGFFRRSIIDPLSIILLLRFPAVAITVYYASITFGSLYFLNISVSSSFSHAPYNFSTLIVGLLYIPSSLGYFLTSVFGGRWLDYVMIREAKKRGTVDERGKLLLSPVDRMQENAWISAILFPGALLWYGWTVENGIHWIVPMIGNFFFGMGSMIVFAMSATMLTEFLPGRASNGVAVNNFVRNIFSCVGALIAEPLIGAIGNGWLCTILSLVAVISGSFVILTMKKYGEAWRQKMTEQLELRDTED